MFTKYSKCTVCQSVFGQFMGYVLIGAVDNQKTRTSDCGQQREFSNGFIRVQNHHHSRYRNRSLKSRELMKREPQQMKLIMENQSVIGCLFNFYSKVVCAFREKSKCDTKWPDYYN